MLYYNNLFNALVHWSIADFCARKKKKSGENHFFKFQSFSN